MATNGESAANWLKEHGETTSLERLQKIRDSIASRLEERAGDDQQHLDLLEALDVMDDYIISKEGDVASNSANTSQLDLTPLCKNTTDASPLLSEDEKQRRFNQLLKTGKLPPVIS